MLSLLSTLSFAAGPVPDAAEAPFAWSLKLNGTPVTLSNEGALKVGIAGWKCGYVLEPLKRSATSVEQFGVVYCESVTGQLVDSQVLCMSRLGKIEDDGKGNLILQQGIDTASMELSCRTTNSAPRVPLQLEPEKPPGQQAGIPTTRQPVVPGTFRWHLATKQGGTEVTAAGDLPVLNPAFQCTQAVSGVEDPTYGYSEYGTISCLHRGTTVSTVVPCVKPKDGTHACMAGNLRMIGKQGEPANLMLMCETVGNPDCIADAAAK